MCVSKVNHIHINCPRMTTELHMYIWNLQDEFTLIHDQVTKKVTNLTKDERNFLNIKLLM